MPQTATVWWTTLYFMFILSFMIMCSILYYHKYILYHKPLKSTESFNKN